MMIPIEPKRMYDRFIGREKMGDEPIDYISVNLHTGSSLIQFASNPKLALENIFEELCRCVKEDQKIFLYGNIPKTPEKIEKKSDIELDISQILSLLKDKIPGLTVIYDNTIPSIDKSEEVKITPEIKYFPFTQQEMNEIKKMYSQRKDMERYPNPFEYQPGIN
jgi:hypothetical protein